MPIEVGDVFRNEGEQATYLVVDNDNPWDEGIEYKVLYLQRGTDSSRFYNLCWIPESILLSKHYVKIGHIDISLLRG